MEDFKVRRRGKERGGQGRGGEGLVGFTRLVRDWGGCGWVEDFKVKREDEGRG